MCGLKRAELGWSKGGALVSVLSTLPGRLRGSVRRQKGRWKQESGGGAVSSIQVLSIRERKRSGPGNTAASANWMACPALPLPLT